MRRTPKPYSDLYLKDVQLNIGYMCELACQLGIPLSEILSRFSISSIALQIERANPHYMVGLSAIEYIKYLYPEKDYNYKDCDFVYGMNFWCGWGYEKTLRHFIHLFSERFTRGPLHDGHAP